MSPSVLQHERLDLLAAGRAEAVALVDSRSGEHVTYDELRGRVRRRSDELGLGRRSLVVIEATNSLEFVTNYLAVLGGGHVPLVAGRHADRLARIWDVDAILRAEPAGALIEHRDSGGHDLHPDLALLLSTSGSTGEPKLVRLSHENLASNARAIASYLALEEADRAITSLPLHYCYGLSVLHSHLIAGASVVLTEASVVDPCFAAAMRQHRVTNLAGVPHTFDLLDRAGPEVIHTASLRFVTQAGGRMAPEHVTRWIEQTEGWGVDFYVMYGQTEATARMAYLPPTLARRRPAAIGVPIPGGRIELRPVDGAGDGVGELVFHGPNVMLGYAATSDDLRLGATLDELRTGDLGRFLADEGVFEIVGRTSRFLKLFGLRIDLDAIERELASNGVIAAVAGDDRRLVICVSNSAEFRSEGLRGADAVRRFVSTFAGLPRAAVVVDSDAIPRTLSGKIDYDRISTRVPSRADVVVATDGSSTVAATFAAVLGSRDVEPSSTFVSLGGDSLNYVECSQRLEPQLGMLPQDWHLWPVSELEALKPRRGVPRIDTTVLLRTLGVCAIVSTHMDYFWFPGGSHLLLAVAGYNLARFHLPIDDVRQRVRAGLRTAARVATPAVAWTAACMLLVGGYGWATLLLVNNNVGPVSHAQGRWHYWFTEVFVQITVIAALVVAIPAVRRMERRAMYLFPLAVFGALLAFRYHWIEFGGATNLRFRTHGVAWFFALGWLARQSTTIMQRIVTSVLALVTVDDFFGRTHREWFIAVGIIALVWVKAVPLPRLAIALVATIAAGSMWIYISHFRIFPPLDRNLPRGLAFALTIACGVAIWRTSELAARAVRFLGWVPRAAGQSSTAASSVAPR